ncbi:MAG: hypothetical protein AB1599_01110 [Planctomycetota bacterium]
MKEERKEMKEGDLALISAAVYTYLSDSRPVNQSIPMDIVLNRPTGQLANRKTCRPNRWKQAFFPYVNEKGLRCVRWSR